MTLFADQTRKEMVLHRFAQWCAEEALKLLDRPEEPFVLAVRMKRGWIEGTVSAELVRDAKVMAQLRYGSREVRREANFAKAAYRCALRAVNFGADDAYGACASHISATGMLASRAAYYERTGSGTLAKGVAREKVVRAQALKLQQLRQEFGTEEVAS